MSSKIATLAYLLLAVGLFWLDREKVRPSRAVWISVAWLCLACSRSLTQWFQIVPMQAGNEAMEGSPLDAFVYLGLLAIGVVVLARRSQRVGSLLRANVPILIFFIYCALSVGWSDYPGIALKRWVKALGDLVAIWIIASDGLPSIAIKKLFSWTSYILVPMSILLIKYYPDLGRGYGDDGKAVYLGVTNNKNTLGVICLGFGLTALWRFLDEYPRRRSAGGRRQLAADGLVLLMVLWLLNISNSMTSSLCFIMASLLILSTKMRVVTRRPLLIHILIATMITISTAVLFLGIGQGLLEAVGRNPTLTDRTEIWRLVLGMVQSPLLGTGFESFWLGTRLQTLWSMYWWHPTEAHNGYIEIYLNLGWIGLVLLGIVLIKGYRTVITALRRNLPASSLRLAFFVVGLVYNFTEAAFFRMMAPAWIFLLLAITSVPELRPRHLKTTPKPHENTTALGDDRAVTLSEAFI
jgi:exopolysaccharide production protein ExoQ